MNYLLKVELPDWLRERINSYADDWRWRKKPTLRYVFDWIEPDRYGIMLRAFATHDSGGYSSFNSIVRSSQTETELVAAADIDIARFDPFEIRLIGIQAWFTSGTPWPWDIHMEIEHNENLLSLASSLDKALAKAEFPPSEIPFKPHLPIALYKLGRGLGHPKWIYPDELINLQFTVEAVTLELGLSAEETKTDRPNYSLLKRFTLGS